MNLCDVLVFIFMIVKIEDSKTAPATPFPSHIDFEKIGEIHVHGETYRILRPRLHEIRDHFEDFILRRGNELPTKKIFLDNNGFRHFWSNVDKSVSLRKMDIEHLSEHLNANEKENSISITKPPNILTETVGKLTTNTSSKTSNNVTTIDKTAVSQAVPFVTPNNAAESNMRRELRSKNAASKNATKAPAKKNPPATKPPATKPPAANPKTPAKTPTEDTKERTIAKTTFFCPFFGLMTLQSYLGEQFAYWGRSLRLKNTVKQSCALFEIECARNNITQPYS